MLRRVLLLLVLLALGGCPKADESLVLVGGARVDVSHIDSDPLALLPSGAIMLGVLDARALFATQLGAQTGAIIAQLLPLGSESNFVASRDVQRVTGAVYAMQGADFCAVLQGNFDTQAIHGAAQARARTPSGVPLVQTTYAGYALYTVANIGFAVLTPRTILSGNETGMRRALDRLRYGRLDHDLQPWMDELLHNQAAPFAMVGDLEQQGVVQAAAPQLPFLNQVRLVRVLGNFQPPGMNLVGSLSYRDAAAATQGAAAMAQLQQLAALASFFAQAPQIDVRQQNNDVAFATSVDAGLMNVVLATIAQVFKPGTASWL
jgi:hypothetical protein